MLKIFKTYDLAAWIIITFAIIIGFVIVLNTSLTNLLEQKKKLSLVKALGQQYSEISKNWFIQSLIQFVLSLIIGLPIGVVIAKIALQKISTENREYVYINNIQMYLITITLVFAYILISHMISMKTLKGFNISENIKEKE
jgi:ABC-type antimicrobial peptide transport system permease subunit